MTTVAYHRTGGWRALAGVLVLGLGLTATAVADSIENDRVRVSLAGKAVSVHLRATTDAPWQLLCQGQLAGLLNPPERMQPYRQKYGTYYLFGEAATVGEVTTGVRDGCPTLSYRTSLEDLWIDTHIRLLAGGALVAVAASGSTDELVPHWQLTFHQRWAADQWLMPAMTHLLFDAPGDDRWQTISAVHQRDNHKFPTFSRYCVAWRRGVDEVWGFLWPPPPRRRPVQFPPGPIVNAYLDAPFVCFAETVPDGADERGVDTVATELYGRMCTFFPNDTTGGK